MVFALSSENVVQYLQERSLCASNQQLASPVKSEEYRNFNLIVSFTNAEYYLVKQERFDSEGNLSGCLRTEWSLQEFLNSFPELNALQTIIAPIIHFDSENSILVVKYLPEYVSLDRFYARLNNYPPEIAGLLGANLGEVHSLTWQKREYLNFLTRNHSHIDGKPDFIAGLALVSPEIFAHICSNGIKFFQLYQRFPSLHQAVVELYDNYQATCLTHNDLRFSNYLIENKDLTSNPQIKLIDWEFWQWGDPAYDLGILLSKYLKLWLDSLLIDSDTDLNLSLSLAGCPLANIQPSLIAILQNYLAVFPKITSARPDFVHRVIQFAGLSLIKWLQLKVERHQPFTNQDICSLQVAKNLLCHPDRSIHSIFGMNHEAISY